MKIMTPALRRQRSQVRILSGAPLDPFPQTQILRDFPDGVVSLVSELRVVFSIDKPEAALRNHANAKMWPEKFHLTSQQIERHSVPFLI